GKVEICNAGHPSPLLIRNGYVNTLEKTNLPVGLFGREEFAVTELWLEPGDGMVIYSDGVPEAIDAAGTEYGVERLHELVGHQAKMDFSALLAACRDDLAEFRRGVPKADDVTLFVLARGEAAEKPNFESFADARTLVSQQSAL